MAVYRNIQTSFWIDPKVTDDFTPEDKYFYLYLFTNPHTNLCGCYEISKKQFAWETGYSKETIDGLMKRFEQVHKVIIYNEETKEILLVNWHKYNWTSSDKFRKSLIKEIEKIKSDDFKRYLTDIYEGKDTVCIPYAYGMHTTVTVSVTDTDTVTVSDTVSDSDTVKKPKSKKFVPPTVEDVMDYAGEKGITINAEDFIDYYASQGWKLSNGNPMKDWQAAARRWAKRSEMDKPRSGTHEMTKEEYFASWGLDGGAFL